MLKENENEIKEKALSYLKKVLGKDTSSFRITCENPLLFKEEMKADYM